MPYHRNTWRATIIEAFNSARSPMMSQRQHKDKAPTQTKEPSTLSSSSTRPQSRTNRDSTFSIASGGSSSTSSTDNSSIFDDSPAGIKSFNSSTHSTPQTPSTPLTPYEEAASKHFSDVSPLANRKSSRLRNNEPKGRRVSCSLLFSKY